MKMTREELRERYVADERNFSGVDLSEANLDGFHLVNANFTGADLSGTTLRDANLHGADLTGANLSCAALNRADLRGADLTGAILRGTYLGGASFYRNQIELLATQALGVIFRDLIE